MIEKINGFKAAVVAIVAAMTALWGWFGWLVVVWVFCMAMDYLTGYGAAIRNGEWSSVIAREGIWHKFGCVITVMVSCILDAAVGYLLGNIPGIALPWDYTVLVAPLVVTWYILMELGSITENAGKMGARIPPFLKKAIKILDTSVNAAGDAAADHEEHTE